MERAESLARRAKGDPLSVGGRGSVLESDLANSTLALVAEMASLVERLEAAEREIASATISCNVAVTRAMKAESRVERLEEALRGIADHPDAAQGWHFQKLAAAVLLHPEEERK